MNDDSPVHPTDKPSGPRKFLPSGGAFKSALSVVQLIIGAVVLAFIINHIVFQSYQVFGQSMVPTLHEGDRLIISKLGKSWSTLLRREYIPKRGEVIVFHNPQTPEIQLVKRVIGIPGDHVVVEDGKIVVFTPAGQTINFDEAFGLVLQPTVGSVDTIVPDGEIFVVGDNRAPGGSLDSRNELGTVPSSQLVGDLVLRIFPINQAELF